MPTKITVQLPPELRPKRTRRQATRRDHERAPGAQLCYVELIEPDYGSDLNAEVLLSVCGYNPGDRIEVESIAEIGLPAHGARFWAAWVFDPDEAQTPPHWVPLTTLCGNYWQFSAEGLPAGGESEWDVEYNGVTERITFPCPCTIAQTRAALETHSEIAPEDLISITGGTLPTSSQKVLFRLQPGDISLAVNSLERSWTAPPSYYWDPL